MTAGRASSLALALVVVITALAAFWAIRHLQPAFQRAYLLDNSLPSDLVAAGQPQSFAPPLPAADLSPAFSPTVLAWGDEILVWAYRFDLDPNLIATVMQIESCGDPQAQSSAGALGLFQVMPYHFEAWEDPLDPEVNARRGLQYLRDGLRLSSGDVVLALAGYNGGHGQIGRPESAWPAETVRYAGWGSGLLRDLEDNSSFSPTLQAWMNAGGDSLCQRASQSLLARQ